MLIVIHSITLCINVELHLANFLHKWHPNGNLNVRVQFDLSERLIVFFSMGTVSFTMSLVLYRIVRLLQLRVCCFSIIQEVKHLEETPSLYLSYGFLSLTSNAICSPSRMTKWCLFYPFRMHIFVMFDAYIIVIWYCMIAFLSKQPDI